MQTDDARPGEVVEQVVTEADRAAYKAASEVIYGMPYEWLYARGLTSNDTHVEGTALWAIAETRRLASPQPPADRAEAEAREGCVCPHDFPGTEDRHYVNCPAHAYYGQYLALRSSSEAPAPAQDAHEDALHLGYDSVTEALKATPRARCRKPYPIMNCIHLHEHEGPHEYGPLLDGGVEMGLASPQPTADRSAFERGLDEACRMIREYADDPSHAKTLAMLETAIFNLRQPECAGVKHWEPML